MNFFLCALLGLAGMGGGVFGASAPNTMPDVIVFKKNVVRPNFVTSDEFPCVILYETEKTVVINRSEIVGVKDEVEIPRFSIEEIRRGQPGTREYEDAMAHAKLPENSETPEYYLRIAAKYFNPFLEKFPNYPQVANVRRARDEYQEELDRVNRGEVRHGGDWTVTVAQMKDQAARENPQTWKEKLEQLAAEKKFDAFYQTVKAMPSAMPDIDFPALAHRVLALIDEIIPQVGDPSKSLEIADLNARLKAATQNLTDTINVHANPVEGDHAGDAAFTKNDKDQKFYRNDSIGNYPQFAAYYVNDGFPKKALGPDQIAQAGNELTHIAKLKAELDQVTGETLELPRLLTEQKRRILDFNLAPYKEMAKKQKNDTITRQLQAFEDAFSRADLIAATNAFLEAKKINPDSPEITVVQQKLQAVYVALAGILLLVLVMMTRFVRGLYTRRK